MDITSQENLASIEFQLGWEKNGVRHTDCLHVDRVNFWRDVLPGSLRQDLMNRTRGEQVQQSFAPGKAVDLPLEQHIRRVKHRHIRPDLAPGLRLQPRYGRFYPAGILKDVPGVFRESVTPFRCVGLDQEAIRADFNHPLAGIPLDVKAAIRDVRPKFEERGGTSYDWIEIAAHGPGLQARCNGGPTDFFADNPFLRADEAVDTAFYAAPRMVQHIDDDAIANISALYRRLLPAGGRVLDLMSSWTSHLPSDVNFAGVTGLGLNRVELEANTRLSEVVVHDLNQHPELPFVADRFDAAVCTVSVEYLTSPEAVFADMARVLRPGGVFVVTFSNRWFPSKAIRIWPELHEFERMGLVLELFLKTGRFENLQTYSLRGRPRPENDKYYPQQREADPVYAVWGTVKAV